MASANKKITQTELSMQLNLSKITIQRLLVQLCISKLHSRFVPKFITAEMMVRRFNACKHNISLMDEIRQRFLENIVTKDETPLSLYIPFSRRVKEVGITRSEASKYTPPWHYPKKDCHANSLFRCQRSSESGFYQRCNQLRLLQSGTK